MRFFVIAVVLCSLVHILQTNAAPNNENDDAEVEGEAAEGKRGKKGPKGKMKPEVLKLKEGENAASRNGKEGTGGRKKSGKGKKKKEEESFAGMDR